MLLVSYAIRILTGDNVELSGNVFFENVHFADSLLTLSYRITKHFSPGVKEPK